VAALAQLVDDAGAELGGDLLSEALADDHALLGNQRQLLDELLPGRTAVEGDDLVELGGGEVAGIERRDWSMISLTRAFMLSSMSGMMAS
jgi:hypothetical protein